MAWLGNFPDLAGAVTKLSESMKNIEKNFDTALGFDEKPESAEASGIWPSASDRKATEEAESLLANSIEDSGGVSTEGLQTPAFELTVSADKEGEAPKSRVVVVDATESTSNVLEHGETESYSQLLSGESETVPSVIGGDRETSQSNQLFPHRDAAELGFTEESRSNASKCANELLSNGPPNIISPGKGPDTVSQANDLEDDNKVQQLCSETIVSDSVDTGVEITKVENGNENDGICIARSC